MESDKKNRELFISLIKSDQPFYGIITYRELMKINELKDQDLVLAHQIYLKLRSWFKKNKEIVAQILRDEAKRTEEYPVCECPKKLLPSLSSLKLVGMCDED